MKILFPVWAATSLMTWSQVSAQAANVASVKALFLVTCGSEVFDKGFNEMAYRAMQKLQEDGKPVEFSFKQFQVDQEVGDDCHPKGSLKDVILTEGFNHVVFLGVGPRQEFIQAAEELAVTHSSDIIFSTIDMVPDNLSERPNMQTALFAEDEGAFLAGVLAGLQSETKVVGGIFGTPYPALKRFRNGFTSGVAHACPECIVESQYIWHFRDVEAGGLVSEYFITQRNADVIFAAAGKTGTGALKQAATRGKWVIGVDSDQFYTVFNGTDSSGGDMVLASVLKRVDKTVERIVNEHLEGAFSGGKILVMDVSNGGMGLSECHLSCPRIAASIAAALELIRGNLVSGTTQTGVDARTGVLSISDKGVPGNAWTAVSGFGQPIGRHQGTAGTTATLFGDEVLFLFGGSTMEHIATNDLWSFNLGSMSWQQHTLSNLVLSDTRIENLLPPERTMASLVTLIDASRSRTCLLLFGGMTAGTSRLKDVWLFFTPLPNEFVFERWERAESTGLHGIETPSSRDGHTMAFARSLIDAETETSFTSESFLFGGRSGSDVFLRDLWRAKTVASYDSSIPSKVVWEKICDPCPPIARRDHSLNHVSGKLYLFGGFAQDKTILKDLWELDTETLVWKKLTDGELARAKHTSSFMTIRPPSSELQPALVFAGGFFSDGVRERDRLSVSYYLLEQDRWQTVYSYGTNQAQPSCSLNSSEVFETAMLPKERIMHNALVAPSSTGQDPDNLLVFGGLDKNNRLLLDVQVFHPSSNDVVENKMYNKTIRVSCIVLGTLGIMAGLVALIWTWSNRKHPVIRASQAPFLALIAVGAVMSCASILTLSVDDEEDAFGLARDGLYAPANAACMQLVWLYTGGFCLMFGPAFAKIQRVLSMVRFFKNKSSPRTATLVSRKALTAFVFGLLLLNWIIVAAWQTVSPLAYVRQPTVIDDYGNILQSVGLCESEHALPFLVTILILHLSILLYGNYICRKARDLSEFFNEGKYLQYSLFSQFELLTLALPFLPLLGKQSAAERVFVLSTVIFLNTMSALGFIFVPKYYNWKYNRKVTLAVSVTDNRTTVFPNNNDTTFFENN